MSQQSKAPIVDFEELMGLLDKAKGEVSRIELGLGMNHIEKVLELMAKRDGDCFQNPETHALVIELQTLCERARRMSFTSEQKAKCRTLKDSINSDLYLDGEPLAAMARMVMGESPPPPPEREPEPTQLQLL